MYNSNKLTGEGYFNYITLTLVEKKFALYITTYVITYYEPLTIFKAVDTSTL